MPRSSGSTPAAAASAARAAWTTRWRSRTRASRASCGAARRCPARSCSSTSTRTATPRSVGSADVNDYIREAAAPTSRAKDFRTWHGTVHALTLWAEQVAAEAAQRLSANQVLAQVAHRLGNTVAVCKKSYVHPRVLEMLAAGEADALERIAGGRSHKVEGLDASERQLLAFLDEAA